MHVLDQNAVTRWTKLGRVWAPSGVNVHCSHCGERSTFVHKQNHQVADKLLLIEYFLILKIFEILLK